MINHVQLILNILYRNKKHFPAFSNQTMYIQQLYNAEGMFQKWLSIVFVTVAELTLHMLQNKSVSSHLWKTICFRIGILHLPPLSTI